MELMHEIPEQKEPLPINRSPLLAPLRLLARFVVFIYKRPVAFVLRSMGIAVVLALVMGFFMRRAEDQAIQSILDNPKLSSVAKIEKLARQLWGDTFKRMKVTGKGGDGGRSVVVFSAYGTDGHYATKKVGLLESLAIRSMKKRSILLFRYAHKLGLQDLTVSLAIPLYTDAIHVKPVEVYRARMSFAEIRKIDGWDDGHPSSKTLGALDGIWQVELDRWRDVILSAQAH